MAITAPASFMRKLTKALQKRIGARGQVVLGQDNLTISFIPEGEGMVWLLRPYDDDGIVFVMYGGIASGVVVYADGNNANEQIDSLVYQAVAVLDGGLSDFFDFTKQPPLPVGQHFMATSENGEWSETHSGDISGVGTTKLTYPAWPK